MSIYNHERTLERIEERIENADYSEENKRLIIRFENFLFAQGLSTPRVLKYLQQLHIISQDLGINFKDATKDDIEYYVARLERSNKKDWTKHDYKQCIKRFYKWLNDEEEPKITSWISLRIRQSKMLPEELLTEEDIVKMIESKTHPRDKAIIAIWYDNGARVGENGNTKIKHITFDKYGAYVLIGKEDGKTGMRRVRLVFSVPYLAAWLDIHPQKKDPNAYLWIRLEGKEVGRQLKYESLRKVIKSAAEKAGVEKRVYNHLFRHSRSTDLAQYLTESQMKEHLGWVQGSNMPQTYVHLSGKQIDEAILKIHGIIKEEDTMPQLTSIACPRCGQVNGPTSGFCSKCGMAMRVDVAVDVEKKRNDIAMALMELMEKEPAIAKILRESV